MEELESVEWHRYATADDGDCDRMVALICKALKPKQNPSPPRVPALACFGHSPVLKLITCSTYL